MPSSIHPKSPQTRDRLTDCDGSKLDSSLFMFIYVVAVDWPTILAGSRHTGSNCCECACARLQRDAAVCEWLCFAWLVTGFAGGFGPRPEGEDNETGLFGFLELIVYSFHRQNSFDIWTFWHWSSSAAAHVQCLKVVDEAPQEAPADTADVTFSLGRTLSIHGQKHIWDNISGDALRVLSHYKQFKARERDNDSRVTCRADLSLS